MARIPAKKMDAVGIQVKLAVAVVLAAAVGVIIDDRPGRKVSRARTASILDFQITRWSTPACREHAQFDGVPASFLLYSFRPGREPGSTSTPDP